MDLHTPQSSDPERIAARSEASLRRLEERARAALAVSREQASRLEAEITARLEALAATATAGDDAVTEKTAEVEQLQAEINRLRGESEAARAGWDVERSSLEAARDELAERLSELDAERHRSRDEWKSQLAEFEQKLAEQQAAWDQQRSQWNDERVALERGRDELHQKFELALEDVARFRGRIAELEQELSRRPEADQADSAELIALRAERDELSSRLEELERQVAQSTDADSQQQLDELRRRFELAVEDVRELKTKNAQLEAQLAETRKHAGGTADSGGMDWESQKRRLLASLEGGDADDDPTRQEERATIQSTIEMTDAIVAEKDREIAELIAQLASSSAPSNVDAERERQIRELIDTDEVIAEHRQRSAQLEREAEEKLRAAELELSVERAKIARQKVELEDLRADLEAQRNALAHNGEAPSAGVPRRRWLSKLGLSGDESQ